VHAASFPGAQKKKKSESTWNEARVYGEFMVTKCCKFMVVSVASKNSQGL